MIKWTRTRQALEEFARRVKDAGILAQGLSKRMCPEASAAACPKVCLPRCQEILWNFSSIWLFLIFHQIISRLMFLWDYMNENHVNEST